MGQSPRQGHALPLPARIRPHRSMSKAGEPEAGQSSGKSVCRIDSMKSRRQLHVFLTGQIRI